MTLNNTEYGLSVTVLQTERGWMVRFVDDDSNGIIEQRIYPSETAALAYAHKIIGVTP